ncbi:hypothetical protein CCMA1212_004352, partial [Trichoderma ghanense]
ALGEGVFTFGWLGTPCLPRRLSSAQRPRDPRATLGPGRNSNLGRRVIWKRQGDRTKDLAAPNAGALPSACGARGTIVASRISRGTSGCKAMFEVDERGRDVRLFTRLDPHQDGPKRRD